MSGKKVTIGLIFIFVGLILFSKSLGVHDYGFGDLVGDLLPLGIIGAGIWLIIRKKKQEDELKIQAKFSFDSKPSDKQENDSAGPYRSGSPHSSVNGKRKYEKLLGELHIDCNGISLENVDISFVLGEVKVMLSGGILSKGLNRVVISGFLGEINIFLPKEFPYFIQASNFLGEIELDGQKSSSIGNSLESQSPNYMEAESKLYISINSFLSTIKVYSV